MAKENYLEQAFKDIAEGVKNVYSSENFKNYLKFSAKFHDYSINNTMLILSQYPDASFVAGYSAWKNKFHRQVRKGEKAIKILAPFQVEIENEETKKIETITRFRMVNVFDVSQTNGEPLPTLVNDLEGTSNNSRALRKAICAISKTRIIFSNENDDLELSKGVKGYFNHKDNVIVVNENLEDNHIAKTLIHEYVHSSFHKCTDKPTDQKEIEAESIAYVVCNYFGVDTHEYSFGYIASYANKDIEELKTILSNIQSFANELIKKIESIFCQERLLIEYQEGYVSPLMYLKESEKCIKYIKDKIKPVSNDVIYNIENITKQIETIFKEDSNFNAMSEIYQLNRHFRENLIQTIEYRLAGKEEEPFLINTFEHRNYLKLKKLAKPIFEKKVTYLKYSSVGMMDLNIEIINEDEIAISHYYECNGDMMADPDVTLKIDNLHELVLPLSYSQDNLGYYITSKTNPKLMNDINEFLDEWLNNIQNTGYKLSEIEINNQRYNVKEDLEEIKIIFEKIDEMPFYLKNIEKNI